MRIEERARDALSSRLEGTYAELFGQDADFIRRNGHVGNELSRGVNEIVNAVGAAAINWDSSGKDELVSDFFTPSLVRLLALEALVSGKLALYPYLEEDGSPSVAVLSGHVHPIFDAHNALKVVGALQVLPVGDGVEVRRFSAGRLEIFPPTQELEKYEDGKPTVHELPHASGRLPVALVLARRDAYRRPSGLVGECLPAFYRYLKTAVNRNAVAEIAGWPERVVQSDKYLQLALGEIAPPAGLSRESILEQLRRVAPRQLKLLGTSDTYHVQNAVDPRPHMEAEAADKQALLDMLCSPDLAGGNLSGVALAERQAKSRALVADLCESVAATVSEAARLLSKMPGTTLAEDVTAMLSPRWPSDNTAKMTLIGELYSKGVISQRVALLELQSAGMSSISDVSIHMHSGTN